MNKFYIVKLKLTTKINASVWFSFFESTSQEIGLNSISFLALIHLIPFFILKRESFQMKIIFTHLNITQIFSTKELYQKYEKICAWTFHKFSLIRIKTFQVSFWEIWEFKIISDWLWMTKHSISIFHYFVVFLINFGNGLAKRKFGISISDKYLTYLFHSWIFSKIFRIILKMDLCSNFILHFWLRFIWFPFSFWNANYFEWK
jgi:hypothetical protein